MVNNWDTIYVERAGKLFWTGTKFHDEGQLRRTIDKIVAKVGRRVDEASPMVDARLPDGSRVNAIIPPLSIDGPSLTIRKFAADPYQADDLVEFGTMSSSVSKFLEACVRGRINIMVAGGTGAGKTTTLNVISSFIPDDERIVTIEDAAELKLQQPHVVRLESRPPNIEGKGQVTIRDLVRQLLRMRPDRIVVGEVRGAEALDMLQAMNTGHDGSISTIHCNSPRDALSRLETITMMAGMDLGSRAIREQIASAIQLIVYQQRLKDGTRRFTHVTEVAGMEGEVITLQDIFLFDFSAGMDDEGRFRGRLKSTGLRPKFIEKLPGARRPRGPRALRDGNEGPLDAGSGHVLLEPGDAPGRRRRSSRWRRSRSAGSCWGRPRASRRTGTWRRGWPRSDAGAADGVASAVDKPGTGWIPESVSSFGERFAKSQGFGEKLDAQLEAAGVSLRSGEFVVATVGAGLLGAVLGAAILQRLLLAGVIGLGAAACRRSSSGRS